MDKKTWIVTANSSCARIFECETVNNWNEIETFIHPQSRLHDRDLASDRAGATSELSGKGRYSMTQPQSPKEIEIHIFAKQVVQFLELARSRGEVDRIFLAASPSFLGLLRNEMGNSLLNIVEKSVDKDISHMKPEMMKDYFFVGV